MQAGRLGPALTIDTGETARTVAVGDVVVGLHNDFRHNLRNGARGVVTALGGEGSLSIRLADGSDATATPGYLAAGRLDHGYAITVHKAQGMTTGRVLLLGSDELYPEAGYVGLSRGRIDNRVYVVDDALAVSVGYVRRHHLRPWGRGVAGETLRSEGHDAGGAHARWRRRATRCSASV